MTDFDINLPAILTHGDTHIGRPFFVYDLDSGPKAELNSGAPFVIIGEDNIRVGNHIITDFTKGHNSVTWRGSGPNWHCSGHLFFAPDRVTAHGSIACGVSAEVADVKTVLASSVASTIYQSTVTKKRYPAKTNPKSLPADAWETGLELDLGYKINPTTNAPETQFDLDKQDLSTSLVSLNTNKEKLLVLVFNAVTDRIFACQTDPKLYLSGSLTFSLFGDKFSGVVETRCSDKDSKSKDVYFWRGQSTDKTYKALVTQMKTEPTAETVAIALTVESQMENLSLVELCSLTPDDNLQDNARKLLVENMKWAIGQDPSRKPWLKQFFAQTAPAIFEWQSDLASRDLQWYQHSFAVPFLVAGFDGASGFGAPTHRLDEKQRAKLNRHLTKGIGSSQSYVRQMAGISSQALLNSRPRLRAYIETDSAQWATQLLKVFSSSSQLTQMANRIMETHDASGASSIGTLLHALDSTGKSTRRYHELLMARIMMTTSMQSTVQDENLTMQWLPQAIDAFVEKYLDSEKAAAGDDRAAIAESLSQASSAFGESTELAAEFTKFMMLAKGQDIRLQAESAREAFARAHPKYDKAGRALFVLAWAGGMFSVIVSFMGWTDLSDNEKTETIGKLVDLTGEAAGEVIGILKPNPKFTEWIELQELSAKNEMLDGFVDVPAGIAGENWCQNGGKNLIEIFDVSGKQILAEESGWGNFLLNAEKAVGAIGVAVSALMTVLSAIDVANDVKDHKSADQKTIDSLLLATNLATTVSLTIGLALASTAAMMASSVFAFAGLIISLVEMFRPKPKETSPVDIFMQDYGFPFIEALPND